MLTVPPTATAPALLLRPWTEQDIPAMVEAHRDPVMRQWLLHPVTNADEARRIIQARRADGEAGIGFSFAVLLAEREGPDDLVGGVSVRGLDGAAVAGEVGYWVAAAARGESPREPSTSYATGPSACHGTNRWKGWNSSTTSATAPPAG
jgi:RimJ/RimL family protein N-acetyltransferase